MLDGCEYCIIGLNEYIRCVIVFHGWILLSGCVYHMVVLCMYCCVTYARVFNVAYLLCVVCMCVRVWVDMSCCVVVLCSVYVWCGVCMSSMVICCMIWYVCL